MKNICAMTAIASAVLLSLELTTPAWGQIVPDNTLPNNSVVTPSGNRFTIDGGSTGGSNLFHSFQEFSVPTGSEAFFNNATSIDNIITRVTGENFSNIDGLIRANGSANLFLLNPNGIMFGPNARLSIGGSFFSTTANSIVFENGYKFSATAQQTQPLLTISVPIGLQWGGQAGEIRVRGGGHSLTTADPIFTPIVRENNGSGLRVNPGNTLALVGGDLRLNGATLTAAGGRIELGGVGVGFVGLIAPSSPDSNQWGLNYDEVSDFRDVQLLRQAAVDVSGTGVGSMQIAGRQITLKDGSLVLLQNRGTQTFGSLQVQASESLALTGTTPDGLIPTGFRQETVGAGNTGDINIITGQLALREGGQIFNRTLGAGKTGKIDIQANDSISLMGTSPLNPTVSSLIANTSFGMGSAGDIAISTRYLSVRSGGVLSTGTFGTGSGGNSFINATEAIEVIGGEPRIGSGSVISATSLGRGNGGSLIINTSRAIVRDGGSIGSSTLASGNSGRLVLNATELVEVSGTMPGVGSSGISASAEKSDEVFQQALRLPPVPSGSPGNVEINTPQLNVRNGGLLTVSNDGTGRAGDIHVNAGSVFLNEGGRITASTRSGEGGNIQLNLDNSLQLRNGSFISAEAGGTGNGGNITIDSSTIALLSGSTIKANALEGNGGNISISTQGLFLSPDSTITASSQFGVDGIVEITNPDIDSTGGLVNLQKKPFDESDRIVTGCAVAGEHSFIITGRGGLPPNPEQPLTGDRPWTDLRDLSAFRSELAKNGRLSDPQENDRDIIVEANAWIVHPDGTIELVALANNSQPQQLPTNCAARPLIPRPTSQ